MNNGYIADDVPIDIVMNGTVLSLEIKTVGCWRIIKKNQLKLNVCNNDIDDFLYSLLSYIPILILCYFR